MLILFSIIVFGNFLPSGIDINDVPSIISSFAEEHINKNVAGANVMVMRNGTIVYSGSFGKYDIENDRNVTINDLFEFGSITKTMTCIGLMQLYERNLINLEDDVEKYLGKGFFKNRKYNEPIKIINLMHHNAGWDDLTVGLSKNGRKDPPTLEYIIKNSEPKQYAKPGSYIAYSNYGVAVAGFLIEKITNKSYASYIKENIFDVLGMNMTTVDISLNDNPYIKNNFQIKGYVSINGKLSIAAKDDYMVTTAPSGAVISTMPDIAKYVASITPSFTNNCPLFQKPDTLSLLFNISLSVNEYAIALSHGFFAFINGQGKKSREHSGNTLKCSSNMRIMPDSGWAILVTTNMLGEYKFTKTLTTKLLGYPFVPVYNGSLPSPNLVLGTYLSTRSVFNGFSSIIYSMYSSKVEFFNSTTIKFMNSLFIQKQPFLFVADESSDAPFPSLFFVMKDQRVEKIHTGPSDFIPISSFRVVIVNVSLAILLIVVIWSLLSILITIIRIFMKILFWKNKYSFISTLSNILNLIIILSLIQTTTKTQHAQPGTFTINLVSIQVSMIMCWISTICYFWPNKKEIDSSQLGNDLILEMTPDEIPKSTKFETTSIFLTLILNIVAIYWEFYK